MDGSEKTSGGAIGFTLRARTPLRVTIDGTDYSFPRFLRKDWKALAAEHDKAREDRAVAHLAEDVDRAKFLMLYPVQPVTWAELAQWVQTIDGAGYVFATCARRAGVPDETVTAFVDGGEVDETDVQNLALMLSGIVDPGRVAERVGRNQASEGSKEGDDPLAATKGGKTT